ncbi:uncharacterized protein I303_102348 [Kwoniella dejecticola CBS 10117]|uniref:Uncharacterized protein n=1 Tax=Kwoniella dejecticola CBS 10117 TaxID=1296121 RepID=A0A1A6AB79_9TREE|nr:uncharacterized protein I303_01511 [Kwoniella dejecticola CBS 10117]OBR87309.1 hypothetical protein I303_01511 [Kwoniella dejecticola CBS 10117]
MCEIANEPVNYQDFQRLLPAHDLIIHFLSQVTPVTYLLLSKYYYEKGISSLYSTFTPNKDSLHGLTQTFPHNQRTLKSLQYVEKLVIGEDTSKSIQDITRCFHPFKSSYRTLFPNVKTLEIKWESLINELRLKCDSGYLPLIYVLWMQVRGTMEELIINLEKAPCICVIRFLEDLITTLAKHFGPKTVTLVYRQSPTHKNIDEGGCTVCPSQLALDMRLPVQIWGSTEVHLDTLKVVCIRPDRRRQARPTTQEEDGEVKEKKEEQVDWVKSTTNEILSKLNSSDREKRNDGSPEWLLEVTEGEEVDQRVLAWTEKKGYHFMPSVNSEEAE